MKKLFALLVAVLMMLLPALAETEPPFPTEPGTDAPGVPDRIVTEVDGDAQEQAPRDHVSGSSIELDINGEKVALDFDASSQYSSIEGGMVQASYYRYLDDGLKLYELYMIFPETAAAGMVISPDYSALTGEESSVVLIVSDLKAEQELYYFSSQMNGTVYPEESTFAIAIDDIQTSGGATTYTGSLSATLIALDMATGEAEDTLQIGETPFSFTIGGETDRPETPAPTALPDDMRKT